MSIATRIEDATNEFRKIQQDLSTVIEGRQRLDSQLRENEIVQKEFQLLKEDSNIFKLIGPVLVKQDKSEAVQNVNKRLEYIQSEIKRMEKQIEDLTQKSEKKKVEVVELRNNYELELQKKPSAST